MIVTRIEGSSAIPERLRAVYENLAGAAIDVLGLHRELTVLYSSQATVDLLNATAPAFFLRHQRLLVDDIFLSLSRLTDNRMSGPRRKHQENLVLSQLLDLPEPELAHLRADLRRKWTVIAKAAEPVREYRHKRLAHTDLM